MKDNDSKLEDLLRVVRTHPEAAFYRSAWGTAASFEELPSVGREDFVTTPLSQRRYKKEKELVKIIHAPEGMFACAWSFADIGRERFGTVGKRPMVYLENPHETLEKSLWCYEQGSVPLAGEQNPDVAAYGAETYGIDSLIADLPALHGLAPTLERFRKPLRSLALLVSLPWREGTLPPPPAWAQEASIVLALPETGAFAQASYAEGALFYPQEGVILQVEGDELVLSKPSYLTTPIIRYRTGFKVRLAGARPEEGFVIVPV